MSAAIFTFPYNKLDDGICPLPISKPLLPWICRHLCSDGKVVFACLRLKICSKLDLFLVLQVSTVALKRFKHNGNGSNVDFVFVKNTLTRRGFDVKDPQEKHRLRREVIYVKEDGFGGLWKIAKKNIIL